MPDSSGPAPLPPVPDPVIGAFAPAALGVEGSTTALSLTGAPPLRRGRADGPRLQNLRDAAASA